jgi:hypothetical protein
MRYGLPKTVTIEGVEYPIETDYRVILDIFEAMNDKDLTGQKKALVILYIFYPTFDQIPEAHLEAALKKCFAFINGEEEYTEPEKRKPQLMDWEQDYRYIIAPVNRIAGQDIRAVDYVHWWTFLSYFQEIGDCYFAQIVRIRKLKANGKLTQKDDKTFYRQNKAAIDIKNKYSAAEEEIISKWI